MIITDRLVTFPIVKIDNDSAFKVLWHSFLSENLVTKVAEYIVQGLATMFIDLSWDRIRKGRPRKGHAQRSIFK